MADWITHLYLAEEIFSKLKFSQREFEIFKWGCVLPDLNNGHFFTPEVTLRHRITHFNEDDYFESFRDFRNQFKGKLNDPLVLGVLFHIYTDKVMCLDYYTKVSLIDWMFREDDRTFMKPRWDDIKLFTSRHMKNFPTLDLSVAKDVVKESKELCLYELSQTDLLQTYDVLPSLYTNLQPEFQFYTDAQLYKLYDKIKLDFVKLLNFIKEENNESKV